MKLMKIVLTAALAATMLFSLTACGGSNAGAPADTDAAVSAVQETADTADAAQEDAADAAQEDTEAIDENFTIGTNDGAVYENTFFNLRLDAAANGLSLADEDQMAQLGNALADELDSETIREALDEGQGFMDLYAYNDDLSETINMNIQNVGVVFGIVGNVEKAVDSILPEMEKQLSDMGIENLTVEKSTCMFQGEETFCVNITGTMNGVPLVEKQLYISEGSYVAFLTASAGSDEACQALLDMVTTAE